MKLKIASLIGFLLLAGCHMQEPDLVAQPKPVVYSAIHQGATSDQIVADPQVDILFIIDDSESMDKYQERLKANMQQFVSAFASTKAIKWQIGVTQIWDSPRYDFLVPPTCKNADGSVHVNYIAPGALLPLKAPNGQEALLSEFAQPFITDKPGYETVLEQSIELGVQHLVKNKKGKPPVCESGPEVEEVLNPIWFSFQPATIAKYNAGFWRPDSFKVFMVLSDAKEGSNLKADFVDSQIRAWLGAPAKGPQNKYRVYVAGMVPGTQITSSCEPDPGFGLSSGVIPEHEIAKLTEISGGKIFSICSPNYGQQLARFGDEIKHATLQNKRQRLSFPPDMNNDKLPADRRFQLKYNGQTLTQGSLAVDAKSGEETVSGGDWAFDSEHNEVVVRGSFWEDHPGAAIDIVYVPVTSLNATTVQTH